MIELSELTWNRFPLLAHQDLAPDRLQTGHAPWSVIRDYGQHYGLVGQVLDDFIALMRKLENAEADGRKAKQMADQGSEPVTTH